MAECQECRFENDFARYDRDISQLKQEALYLRQDSERNQTTHKEFFNRFEDIKVNMATQTSEFSHISSKIDDMAQDVKEIKEKPSKRTDVIITAILSSLGTAIGGAIIFALSNGLIR